MSAPPTGHPSVYSRTISEMNHGRTATMCGPSLTKPLFSLLRCHLCGSCFQGCLRSCTRLIALLPARQNRRIGRGTLRAPLVPIIRSGPAPALPPTRGRPWACVERNRMSTFTEAAGEYLNEWLANTGADVIRLSRNAEFWLDADIARPGDVAIAHRDRVVLVLHERLSMFLAQNTLGVENGDEGPQLAVL